MDQKKRERSANFDKAEVLLLTEIVTKYKDIVENKKTDTVTNKDKEAVWNKIAAAFNASQGSNFRTAKTLKLKYEGIKKNTKKKRALQRQEMYRTGGGTSTAPELDNVEEKVIAICSNIAGLDARNDSDNLRDFAIPEAIIISDDTCIEITSDQYGFDTKQIVEDNLEKGETQKDQDGFDTKQIFEDNLEKGETQEDFKKDWSDHALWWPTRNKWLARPKHTLDQYGVHADAALHFTPMHKPLRIQLPDLRYVDCKIDFSIDTFSAVVQLCKSLGIRHPEELSLCYPLEQSHLKQNYQNLKEAKRIKSTHPADTNTFLAATRGSSNSLDRSNGPCPATPPPPRSLSATPVASQQNGTLRRYGNHIYSTQSDGSSDGGYCGTPPRAASMDALDSLAELSLADSPLEPDSQSKESLLTPKSLMERARMNVGWLDSSLSIMEQWVREWDTLQLRFKFYSFFDLTPRAADAPRLNQLYQQARWQILNQELHCTEEEMLLFAALQLQIELQTLAGGSVDAADGSGGNTSTASAPEDEIEAALSELQATLEGGPPARPDITHVPELAGYLKYLRPKRFTLKAYKRGWLSCRDGVLRIHSSRDAAAKGEPPSYSVELRGAEVTPDAHPASGRYSIKLEVPAEDAMHEMWLKCENEEQYAEWVVACRLGARGRSLADAAFGAEANAVRALLALQRPRPAAALSQHSVPHLDQLQPDNYLAPRFLKKLKGKFTQRVLESHANVKELPLLEAKLQYIKTWQNLPDYGQTLFVVRFMGHRKDEIISIANNRIMRLDPNTGDHIKTWRFSTMKAWNVNWEIKHMMVQFEEGNIIFSVQSADCKVVHEFIGGYIFLSMRSKDANQNLDEEMFHKLTGGWT